MRVLSVDGGSVRGAVPVVILARLERHLGRPLRRHFDLIAGTSTGALVAAAVAAEVPMAELVVRWPALTHDVFGGRGTIASLRALFRDGPSGPLYESAPLAAAAERIVGRRMLGSLSAATMLFAYDVEMGREVVAPLLPRSSAHRRAARLLWRTWVLPGRVVVGAAAHGSTGASQRAAPRPARRGRCRGNLTT